MDHESMSRNLMNYSVGGYVLNIAVSGNEVAWMKRKGDDYVFETSWCLDFDMLSGFDFLRKVMKTETLIISFNAFNVFEAELSHKKRDGGYKEPFHKEIYDTANGYSILEVLSKLNEREKSRQEVNGSKLELVKR